MFARDAVAGKHARPSREQAAGRYAGSVFSLQQMFMVASSSSTGL